MYYIHFSMSFSSTPPIDIIDTMASKHNDDTRSWCIILSSCNNTLHGNGKMGHGVRMLFLLAQSFLRLNMGRDPPIHIQREIETNYT